MATNKHHPPLRNPNYPFYLFFQIANEEIAAEMKEKMDRLWQWIRDRKTNTVRRWRSSLLRVGGSFDRVANGVPHSYSAMSLPSENKQRPPEYDRFFEDPQLKEVLEVRRRSFRGPRPEQQPVPPPDVECPIPNPYIERLTPTATPRGTPQRERRSPRQIRFQLPEVRVSFEEERNHQILLPRSASPLPPAEVEWSPVMAHMQVNGERLEVQTPPMPIEASPSPTSRRNSASERARQNLLAQRRQSNVQIAQTMTGRRTSTTLIPLTGAQIHLVRSLWRQIITSKGPTVLGTSIYHRLCFKCPLVKEQIRRVELPGNFRDHDTFIKAHSKALAELIDQVIENLDNLDNMTEELVRIGRVHARILHGELTGKVWNVVAETFIDCTLEWGDKRCRSETVRKAWALIIAFVVEKIKLGHHEQRKIMLSTRQSFAGIESPLSDLRMS